MTDVRDVAIQQAIEARDFEILRKLAFEAGGFGEDFRLRAWLTLLGVGGEGPESRTVDVTPKEMRTIEADVARSVYTWDVHMDIEESVRAEKREQLQRIMCSVLDKHNSQLTYFQGFHDIALVFLEMGTAEQALHMLEKVALFYLSDQLCWPFDSGVEPMLSVFFRLLQALDTELHTALAEAGITQYHFALPWLLTWFAHSLNKLHEQVARLYDCLLASHPLILFYFSVAMLTTHREEILNAPRDQMEMQMVLQTLPMKTKDVDNWAIEVSKLSQRLQPEAFMQRMPWRLWLTLPPTSPLRHYPYPWMTSAAATTADLAPVYTTSKLLLSMSPAGLRPRVKRLRQKLRQKLREAPVCIGIGFFGTTFCISKLMAGCFFMCMAVAFSFTKFTRLWRGGRKVGN
mmetsp:Transcript_26613/g.48770  ORF Transcript_26613/g.48770 Transcript_26613/m.48770 type:complete len:402 (-) Transcript_26613:61-1266(-)